MTEVASSVGTTSEATLPGDENALKEGDATANGEKTAEQQVNDGEPAPERDTWASKVGYILTLIGYAVGFGNVWRFPYLLHANGGAAFLIPYLIMLALEGIPLFFLELAVGQRMRKGSVGSWNEVSPYLGGVGIACGVVCYLCCLYYNTLLAWVLSYLFDSFRDPLPWKDCYTASYDLVKGNNNGTDDMNRTVTKECLNANQASKYYWFRKALDVSDSITEPGNFNPYIMLYLIISWVIIWGILVKGIKTSEKVVYFTALFPYVTLIIFLIGNFFLDGWENGYKYLLKPDFSVLLDPGVWLKAGTQIFFSLGIGFGVLITFASYVPSNNNCYKDAISVALINCSTSMLAALVIFPVLGSQGTRKFEECKEMRRVTLMMELNLVGHLNIDLNDKSKTDLFSISEEKGEFLSYTYQGIKIPLKPPYKLIKSLDCDLENEVRGSGGGTGLVFIAFAEAALHLPAPQFWCFLFFFMLFTLGVDSGFSTTEGAISALEDMRLLPWPRWALTSIVCGSCLAVSMVLTMGFGVYVEVFTDQFVCNWSVLIIAFFEAVGIGWVYGLAQFSYDVLLMTGKKPNLFMLACWKFISPFLLIVILVMSIVQQLKDGYNYDKYNTLKGDTELAPYPGALIGLGYILWLACVIWVPLQAILVYFGKSLLKPAVAAAFPEEELRAERNLKEDDDEHFGDMDKLLMGKSIDDFTAYRERSKSSIHSEDHKRSSKTKATVGDGAT